METSIEEKIELFFKQKSIARIPTEGKIESLISKLSSLPGVKEDGTIQELSDLIKSKNSEISYHLEEIRSLAEAVNLIFQMKSIPSELYKSIFQSVDDILEIIRN